MEINRINLKLDPEVFNTLRVIREAQEESFQELALISKQVSSMFKPTIEVLNGISSIMRNRSKFYISLMQNTEPPKLEYKILEFDCGKSDISQHLDVKKRLIGFKQSYKENR